ncbi:MAG: lysylphosphatidylglycerol synthase transmembrane domain-containing protein [Polyangia bacterium]
MSGEQRARRPPVKALRVAAGAAFTAWVAWLAIGHLDAGELGDVFSEVRLGPLLAALLVYAVATGLRAVRFWLSGARAEPRELFGIAAAHAALLRVMPLRSGELAYGLLLRRAGGGGFGEGMAALVLLRVLDLAALLPLAAAVIAFGPLGVGGGGAVAILAVAAAACAALFFAVGPISRCLAERFAPGEERSLGRAGRALALVARAYDIPLRRKLELVASTIAIWGLIALWFHLLLGAVGQPLDPVEGISVAVLGMVGSALPLSLIGSFGPMESGFALGLIALGRPDGAAAAAALGVSALSLLINWALGLPALGWLSYRRAPDGALQRRLLRAAGVAGFAVAGALLLLARIRYGFETNDQVQYFLLPYREIFDSFCPGDWFTWGTTHYHVSFSWLIRGLHALLGAGLFPAGVLAVHLAALAGVSAGLLALARANGWSWIAAAVALLITAFVRHEGIAGALVSHGLLLPADMALAPLLLGLAAWLSRRPLAAGLWLGLSGLLHANFAVLGPALIALPEGWRLLRGRDWRSSLALAGGYLALAWPTLWIAAGSFLASDSAPGAVDIMFRIRSPHHYDPQLLGPLAPWWPLVLGVSGLTAWAARDRSAPERDSLRLIGAMAAWQLVAAIGAALELAPIVRLFAWRLSVPLALLLAVAAGESLVRAVRRRSFAELCWWVGCAAIAAGFAAPGRIETGGETRLTGSALLLPLLAPAAIAGALLARRRTGSLPAAISALLSAVVIVGAAAVSIPGAAADRGRHLRWSEAVESWSSFPRPRVGPPRGRIPALYGWIRERAPDGALFLAPPGLDDFRLRTRRGIFVDWKCCPMKGDEALEWKRRMLAAIGADRFPARGYRLAGVADRLFLSRPLAELAELARREGLTHVLTRRFSAVAVGRAGLVRRATRGRWAIYEVLSAGE